MKKDLSIEVGQWTENDFSASNTNFSPTPTGRAVVTVVGTESARTFRVYVNGTLNLTLVNTGSRWFDANGGSRYADPPGINNYTTEPRYADRRAAIKYGAKHYQEVYWLCMYGTNDLVGGVMDPYTSTWQAGRDIIDAMILDDKSAADMADRSKVKLTLMTIPPRGDWLDPSTNEETARLAYNADCVANYASRGYDFRLDIAAYTPDGFASFEACAIDAKGVGNSIFNSGAVHFTSSGGIEIATNVHTPFLNTRAGLLT